MYITMLEGFQTPPGCNYGNTHSRSESWLLKKPMSLISSSIRSNARSSRVLSIISTGSSKSWGVERIEERLRRHNTGTVSKQIDVFVDLWQKQDPYVQEELHNCVCREQAIKFNHTVFFENIDASLLMQT